MPLDEVAFASLRSRVVMVPQDGFLFDATVADNVRYGRPGMTDARDRGRLRGARPGRLARRPRRRRPDNGRPARGVAVGGGAAAGRGRPRLRRRSRPAGARRGDQRRRPGHRAAAHPGAGHPHRRPDDAHDRAPALHRRAGRRDPGGGRRPRRPARDARRARRRRGPLRAAARLLAPLLGRGADARRSEHGTPQLGARPRRPTLPVMPSSSSRSRVPVRRSPRPAPWGADAAPPRGTPAGRPFRRRLRSAAGRRGRSTWAGCSGARPRVGTHLFVPVAARRPGGGRRRRPCSWSSGPRAGWSSPSRPSSRCSGCWAWSSSSPRSAAAGRCGARVRCWSVRWRCLVLTLRRPVRDWSRPAGRVARRGDGARRGPAR